MEAKNLKVSVQNFGPVSQGEFELKPLTIFIGPNNSGKSYMALLVHSLTQALSGRPHGPYRTFATRLSDWEYEYFEKHEKELEKWIRSLYKPRSAKPEDMVFRDLPENVKRVLLGGFNERLHGLKDDLEGTLKDYFGCDNVADLVRTEHRDRPLSFKLNDHEGKPPFLTYSLAQKDGAGAVDGAIPDIDTLRVPISEIIRRPYFPHVTIKAMQMVLGAPLWFRLWLEVLKENGIPQPSSYYLPAGRSGILQGWQVLMSMAVELLRRRFGYSRVDVSPFIGVTSDFLQVLLEEILARPRRRERQEMGPVLQVLEGQVFQGEVALEEARQERARLLYKTANLSLPLQRASSMVGELAPLDLWVKYILDPGDLLIIDEPEAHLHPENQSRIARTLVRLVRAGVRVLCTTHSSVILHQVSNHLLASEAEPRTREKQGFTDDDLIDSADVGVYLFGMEEDGTHIKPVPIEPGFGISEDEFVRVSESLGEETHRLTPLS